MPPRARPSATARGEVPAQREDGDFEAPLARSAKSSPARTRAKTAKTTRTASSKTAAPAAPEPAPVRNVVPAQKAGRRALTPQERAEKPVTATVAAYIFWLDENIFDGKMSEPQKKAAGIAITLYGAFQASPERKRARGV